MVPSIYQTWYHTTVLGQHLREGEHYRDYIRVNSQIEQEDPGSWFHFTFLEYRIRSC